jgi:hypothetical protein
MEKAFATLVYATGSQIDKVPAIYRGRTSLRSAATVTTASKGSKVAASQLGGTGWRGNRRRGV